MENGDSDKENRGKVIEVEPRALLYTLKKTKITFPVVLQWKAVTLRELVTKELDRIRTDIRPYEMIETGPRRDSKAFQQGKKKMSQIMASLVVHSALNPTITPRTILWEEIKEQELWRRYRIHSENGQRIDHFMSDFIVQNVRGFGDILERMTRVTLYEIEPDSH